MDTITEDDSLIRDVHNVLVGIIHFSSQQSSSCKRRGFVKKQFSAFFAPFNKIWVRTNKVTTTFDVYARVKVDWSKSDINKGIIECSVEEYIGRVSDFTLEDAVIRQLCTSHWSQRVTREIKKMNYDYDVCSDRVDLTDIASYSIDPEGCVDIDDAIHYRRLKDGHEIGVHIADVTSYFPIDSTVWSEMNRRVETVYTDHVYHMYPEEFSIMRAALSEGSRSRAFSLIISLDSKLNITDYKFVESYVNVKNISYETADEIWSSRTRDDSNEDIKMIFNISKILCEKIMDRPAIDSHDVVETFMVLANNIAARYMMDSEMLKSSGSKALIRTQGSCDSPEYTNLAVEGEVLDVIGYLNADRAEYRLYEDGVDSRHHSLNLDQYTHFTSPIRRYADVLVHQTIRAIMREDISMLPKMNAKDILKLNHYKSYYRRCVMYSNEIKILSQMETSHMDVKATVVDITNERCRVLVRDIGDIDKIIINTDILTPKITRSIADNNEIDLSMTPTGCRIQLRGKDGESVDGRSVNIDIGDEVTVKICYIPRQLKKLKAYIITPDVHSIMFG